MISSDKIAEAETLLRLQQIHEGQHFIRLMNEAFDEAMMGLLYASPEEIHVKQGRAQALNNLLKKFVDAKKTIDATRTGSR
jgi:hypothetical protein